MKKAIILLIAIIMPSLAFGFSQADKNRLDAKVAALQKETAAARENLAKADTKVAQLDDYAKGQWLRAEAAEAQVKRERVGKLKLIVISALFFGLIGFVAGIAIIGSRSNVAVLSASEPRPLWQSTVKTTRKTTAPKKKAPRK